MAYQLDISTTLSRLDEGRFAFSGEGVYLNFDTAYGGWAAALAVEAVQSADGSRGAPVSLTATFPDAITPEPLEIAVTLLRRRARTDFWRVAFLRAAAPDEAVFHADIVMSEERTSDLDYQITAPAAPDPDTVIAPDRKMGPGWWKHIAIRPINMPFFTKAETPDTLSWMKESDDRPLDAKGLIALSDALPPRSFFLDNKPRFGSTVTMSVSLFASAEDYAAVGSDFLLSQGECDIVRNGTYDLRGRLWTRGGKLLAVMNQIAYHK
ncbi:MAG: thioesterase family protein [Pseudomonadota bacterium]